MNIYITNENTVNCFHRSFKREYKYDRTNEIGDVDSKSVAAFFDMLRKGGKISDILNYVLVMRIWQ